MIGHDCMASGPLFGSWIPDVSTWRCACGQEWIRRSGAWERVGGPAGSVASAEAWAAARALATQLLEDRIGRPATRELALRVLAEGRPDPPEIRVEYRTSYTISHEPGCPNAEAVLERGVCASCDAQMVYEGETRRVWRDGVEIETEAARRNVGGDAGNLEPEAGR